ncbi:MAG TPA: biotin/lipoyl-binding protein [Bryobacteraceae bacterium]|jgi:HlyD family secretion protein|nr:biotin/lipoyl-binding protein [Bryobacteraceae bacterium]
MNKLLFGLSFIGLTAGCVVAYLSGITQPPLPPAFSPATNPYPRGIYANGILESEQTSGANINVYPEVPGTVTQILVSEGQEVKKGTVLLRVGDSVQRATTEQLQAQAQAAFTLLNELKAQPRKENLDVAEAQVVAAEAALKTAQDTLEKQQAAFDLDPKSISKDALDSAQNAVLTEKANLDVARKQRDLTKAGAWIYDINNQEKQYNALTKSYLSASALLSKYSLLAPKDGRVLAINTAVGDFISAQGGYDTYTQGMTPTLVLGSSEDQLHVRCYVDEILVPRLPAPSRMKAQMSVRGSNVKVPLEYVRMQPIVSPKIELSDQRLERVDVRVLPVIFRVEKAKQLNLYPGQLVDVYISE